MKRNSKYKITTSEFFSHANDIDIYIEDKNESRSYEKLYTILLQRVFQYKYKIIKVFMINGCNQLEETHKKLMQTYRKKTLSRPSLCILDGDFKFLHSDRHISKEGIYVLHRYSIENYLINKDTIDKYIHDTCPELCTDNIDSDFDFNQWFCLNNRISIKLYKTYCIQDAIVKENLKVKSSKRPIQDYNPDSLGIINKEAVDRIIAIIIGIIKHEGLCERAKDVLIRVNKKIKENGFNMLHICSGKSFLLPLLKLRILNKYKIKLLDDYLPDLNKRLENCCTISSSESFRNYLCTNSNELPFTDIEQYVLKPTNTSAIST